MTQHPTDNITPDDGAKDKQSQDKPHAHEDSPESMQRIMEMGMSSMQSSVMGQINPIAAKLTEEHISKIINITADDNKRSHGQHNSNRNALLGILLGVAIIFVFLVVYLTVAGKDGLLEKVLTGMLGFLGGFGTAFGVKSFNK